MKNSNKSLIICIFVIMILIISGYFGYKLGIEEEKKNKEFSKNYNAKKPQSLNIDEQVTVDILSYIEVEGYILPEVVDIKDSGTKVGNIKISNLQINPKLEEKIILNVPKK